MVEKDAQRLIAWLAATWSIPKEALEVELAVNPRLTRAVARFLRRPRVIELGPRFFELGSRHEEILCHEFAHVAVDFVHGSSAKPHGLEWRRLVKAAGYRAEPRTTGALPIEQGPAVPKRRASPTAVYEHRCPVCQMVRRAKRPVPQWRCAACVAAGLPGTLQITRLPQSESAAIGAARGVCITCASRSMCPPPRARTFDWLRVASPEVPWCADEVRRREEGAVRGGRTQWGELVGALVG